MEIRKIAKASLVLILIGLFFVIVSVILKLLPAFVDPSMRDSVALANTIYSFISIILFFGISIIAGMRATRKFGFDPMGAGSVAAFTNIGIEVLHLLINAVIQLLIVNKIIPGTYLSTESAFAAAVFQQLAGSGGVVISSLCGIGLIIISALLSFIVGAITGILVRR